MLLFFTTTIPADGTPESHCQPHEVEALAVRLGIPVVPLSGRRRRCGHDNSGHLLVVGEHDKSGKPYYYLDGNETDHVAPLIEEHEHEGDPVVIHSHEMMDAQGNVIMVAVLSPHEQAMHAATHVCHNHVWFEVPDGYTMPTEIILKLRAAMERGEPVPKPVGIPLPAGVTPQAAIDALSFDGNQILTGEHGPVQYLSGPLGLSAVYCCLDCKDKHNVARCEQVLSRLPDPTTRPVRGSQSVERRVSLERKLVTAGGGVITEEIVTETILEDKALYRERLRRWYLASGCWA